MRGSNNRDSVDTAKEEKSFSKNSRSKTNNKMLTISEVFGMKSNKRGSKVVKSKPKTMRSNKSQKNLKNRLKNLKTSLENPETKVKKLKLGLNSRKRKKDSKGLGLNRSFNGRNSRRQTRKAQLRAGSPGINTSRHMVNRILDPTDIIFS
jgi:hypothetical protein